MRKALIMLAMLLACPISAQQQATSASGAVLRTLDKLTGRTLDVVIASGRTESVGNLKVVLADCRFPAGNPAGDAYAALEISEVGQAGVLFSGWMIASAPALNALEHSRYDVWVIRCTTS